MNIEATQEALAGDAPVALPKRRWGCFKTGCLGCLGVGFVGLTIVALMFFIALVQGPPEQKSENAEISRVLPGGGTVSLDSIAPATGEGPESPPDADGPVPDRSGHPGRIILDLSMGSFEIVPGPPGQPLRVEADYDSGGYELTEEFEPDGENGWTYRLSFGSKVSMFRHMLGSFKDQNEINNRIRLIVPRDVPVAVSGRVGVGESDFDFGGLWLTDLALSMGVGEHRVDFKEPTREPVEKIDVTMSIGEFGVRRIGNASPRQVNINQTLGEAYYDLKGNWLRDSIVNLSCGIGECGVHLPDERFGLDVGRATLMIGESNTRDVDRRQAPPPGAPVIKLEVAQTLGELRLTD